MDTRIESASVAQVICTVEPDSEHDDRVVVTYWLTSGQKIGSLNVPRG